MNYTVVWLKSADAELAELWLNSALRSQVAEAASTIDRLLARDPYSHSESRESDRRVIVVTPLAVIFRVVESDRMVRVLRVRSFKQRPKGQ